MGQNWIEIGYNKTRGLNVGTVSSYKIHNIKTPTFYDIFSHFEFVVSSKPSESHFRPPYPVLN